MEFRPGRNTDVLADAVLDVQRDMDRLRRILWLDKERQQHSPEIHVRHAGGVLQAAGSRPTNVHRLHVPRPRPIEPGWQSAFAGVAPICLKPRVERDFEACQPMCARVIAGNEPGARVKTLRPPGQILTEGDPRHQAEADTKEGRNKGNSIYHGTRGRL